MVLPMTESQQERERDATRLRLSEAEAQDLRGLLRCTHVPEFDELARLRTGRVIAKAAYEPSRADGGRGSFPMDWIDQVTLL